MAGARQLYAQHINAGGTALWPNAVRLPTSLIHAWIGSATLNRTVLALMVPGVHL